MGYLEFKKYAAIAGYRNPLQQASFKPRPVGPVASVNVANQNRSTQWQKDAPLLTAQTAADKRFRQQNIKPEARAAAMFGAAPNRQQASTQPQQQNQQTAAQEQPTLTPTQLAAQQRAEQAAQAPVQSNKSVPAYTPLDKNNFRPTEEDTKYRVAENRFQNIDDPASAVAGFKQEMNEGIRRGRGDLAMGLTYGGKSEATVAPAAIAANQGVVDSALYALERADDNVIDYLVQNPNAVAEMTAYLSDEDKAKVQSIIDWRAGGGTIQPSAAEPQEYPALSESYTQPLANNYRPGATPVSPSESGKPGGLPDLNGPMGPQAKDMFTKANVKSYRDFLAMNDEQRTQFASTPEGEKLLNDFESFFGDPNLDAGMRADRLIEAVKAGDPSVALLGNDILKLMDKAGDETELTGMAAEVKKMFGGLDEEKQKEIKAAFQGQMWSAVASNPIENLPIAASVFLRSIGLGGVADFTENPWIFYLGSLALLFGAGSLLAGGDEPTYNNGGQPDTRMSRVPYAF